MWTVTRQLQYPDGDKVVEISYGGIDYTNPDALAAKYPGEFREFTDPREAAETAIAIAMAWQSDTDEEILIAHGATGGMTMPFSGNELTDETFTDLRQWAEKEWEELPKCDWCGEPLPDERSQYTLIDYPDEHYCSENCADRAWEQIEEAQAELEAEEEEE